MAMSKYSQGGSFHECFYRCESKKHASNLTAVVIKSKLSDEKVASFLKWCCVKYLQAVDFNGRTLIHVAASKGRLELLKFLLTQQDVIINSKDFESEYSPLHSSLFYGQIDCAVKLIQKGANIQQTDADDLTPLDHPMKDRPAILCYNVNQPCEVYVWGTNTNYTLGIGHNHSRSNPDVLDFFRKENVSIKQVFMSRFHSLFLGSNGRIWACGLGSGGRLGLGDETTVLVPRALKIGNNSELCNSASIGIDHSILLMENGSVWSFGLNTYHQLGHHPPPEKVVYPKAIKGLKGFEIIGIGASKFHSVFWTKSQLLTCGLHGGQLGHDKTNENTISSPKVVSRLDLKSSTIKHVATSDGATVIVSSKGDIFLLHEYQCKKLTSKTSKFSTKKICVVGGHLNHKVYTVGLEEKGGDELKIIILTDTDRIYFWQETQPQMIRCLLSLHRSVIITDLTLNKVSLLLTTADGEAFQGIVKAKKKKTNMEDDKSSPKSGFNKFINKDDCNLIKLKRIPNIHRAKNIACDLKGRNFAVVQVNPKSGLLEIPFVESSVMKENMKMLLTTADEYDTLHDVVFEVEGMKFPAHRYIVSHSCRIIEELINDSEIIENVHLVTISNIQANVFERILMYLYTGECNLADLGVYFECPEFSKKEEEPLNEEEISEFEYHKQQRSNRKKKFESKDNDFIKSLRDASRYFELTNLSKILESFRHDSNFTCRTKNKKPEFSTPIFDRKNLQNLWDINLESENGEIIKAHKCILVARMEYFNCMINQGWLESSLKAPLKFLVPGNVLEILIRFLYTDDAPELMNTDDPYLASHVLVVADQYFCTRLKEIAESSLANMINLKNAAEMLQIAVTYNANQLKTCVMEFICLNLSAFLESQSLEILDDFLLTELKDFYRSWLPCMRNRKVGTNIEPPDDEFIITIHNSESNFLDKVTEEITNKQNTKALKKKSRKEKRASESENQRVRNTSVGSTTSDEELFSSLDYSDSGHGEQTWIMVSNHSNKQQRNSQTKIKTPPSESSKTLTNNIGKVQMSPVEKSSPSIPVRYPPKRESLVFNETEKDFISTSCKKQFPALSASAPDRIITVATSKSPSESSKKFVKLSQKQRKKIANQSKSEDENNTRKPTLETVKSAWGVPKIQSASLSDIMKGEKTQQSFVTSSPPWQKTSSSNCSLSAIMAAERHQKDLISKIKSKPLEYTQMEDKAIDDLMLLYDIPNVTDERITIRRADPILLTSPVWVSSHRS